MIAYACRILKNRWKRRTQQKILAMRRRLQQRRLRLQRRQQQRALAVRQRQQRRRRRRRLRRAALLPLRLLLLPKPTSMAKAMPISRRRAVAGWRCFKYVPRARFVDKRLFVTFSPSIGHCTRAKTQRRMLRACRWQNRLLRLWWRRRSGA